MEKELLPHLSYQKWVDENFQEIAEQVERAKRFLPPPEKLKSLIV